LAEADVQPEKLHRLEVIEPPHSGGGRICRRNSLAR
jgi:hypothetical protein